ncbi:polygalacturonase/tailspike protein [Bacteroides phage PhiCrAssBcn17]|nr:polygalacturonase/tailspike protein [Bacteroides phage PhiCrAssBcn17]
MFFTQEDYRKIEKWFLANSRKDTDFAGAATPLKGNETVVLVQNGKNVKASVKDVVEQLFLLGVSDFVNITDKYGESYISLSQAIELIPYRSRKIGQVVTFLDDTGKWAMFQFQGTRKNQWGTLSLWVDLIDLMTGLTITDSEDIVTETNSANQVALKFADKTYNEADYSGLGRVYLRKNIVNVEDPVTGNIVTMNYLQQSMISKENTIYIIQYDYNLNGQTITIPSGCVLKFEGGSISNGSIKGTDTNIIAPQIRIFNTILLSGTWKVRDIFDDWFDFNATTNFDNINNFYNISILQSDDLENNVILKGNYYSSLKDGIVLSLSSNTNLVLNGSISLLPNNLSSYSIIKGVDKENIKISGGGRLIGDLQNHLGNTGEWGFGISFTGCKTISITNIDSSYMWGDGLYIGASDDTEEETLSQNIQVNNCKFEYNRRQGISITGAVDVFVNNCYFFNTGRINGTNPKAGLDIEPSGLYNSNVTISNCIADSNVSTGFLVYGDNRNIVIDNCASKNQLISITISQRSATTDNDDVFIRHGNIGGSLQITRGNIRVEDCEVDSVYFTADTSGIGANVTISNSVLGAKRWEGSTYFNSVFLIDSNSQINNLYVFDSKIDYDPSILTQGLFNIAGSSIRDNILFENCDISQKNTVNSLNTKVGSYRNCRFYNMTRIYLANEPNKTVEFTDNYCAMTKESPSTNIFSFLNSGNTQDVILFVVRNNTFSTKGSINVGSIGLIDVTGVNLGNKMIFENNHFLTQYPLTQEQIIKALSNRITVDTNYNFTSRFPYRATLESLPAYNAFDAGALIYGDDNLLYFWNGTNLTNSEGTDARKVVIV